MRKASYYDHFFYRAEDRALAAMMPSVRFLPDALLTERHSTEMHAVHEPSDELGLFLHEAAIFEYRDVLFASWYTCPELELSGATPIVGRRSYDGGRSWSEPEIIAEDKTGRILYCPPVYGVSDGKLYMLINEMVGADLMHALNLYVLDPESDRFVLVWSRPIPFKLNTNVVTLSDGRLLLPGRIAELDGFPNTPAVLISDSGKIDAEWRLVRIAEDGNLPDGARLVHPELTVIEEGGVLYMLCRDDERRVPLVYLSEDMGESWSALHSHDIPLVGSKIYGGTLCDGRHYLVANEAMKTRFHREKLVVYLTKPHSMEIAEKVVLFDNEHNSLPKYTICHYPCVIEYRGELLVIATLDYRIEGRAPRPAEAIRGAVLFRVTLQ